MNEHQARALVRARSEGWCEVRIPDICRGRATNFQHRKNRSANGGWSPANGIDICGSGTTGCHGYIHANPAEATRWGWTVKSWDDPAITPVLLWTLHYQRAMVVLDDDACYHLAPWPDGVDGDPFTLPVTDQWGAA